MSIWKPKFPGISVGDSIPAIWSRHLLVWLSLEMRPKVPWLHGMRRFIFPLLHKEHGVIPGKAVEDQHTDNVGCEGRSPFPVEVLFNTRRSTTRCFKGL